MVPRCCGHRSRDVRPPKKHVNSLLPQCSSNSPPRPQHWLSFSRTHTCYPQGRAPTGPPLLGVNHCRRPLGAGIQCQTAPSPPAPVHLVHLPVMRKRPRFRPWCCLSAVLPTRPEIIRKNPWAWSPLFLALRQNRNSNPRSAARSGLERP